MLDVLRTRKRRTERCFTLFVWFSLVCFTQSSADIVQSLVLNPSPAALLLSPSLLFLFKNVQN